MICADYGDRDRLDAVDTKLVADIGERGWGVIMVPADDISPGWAFTVGLWHSHRSPELAMFGLDPYEAMACLNILGDGVRDGRPVAEGQERDDVLVERSVVLRPVHDGWRAEFLGTASGFYRATRGVPFLQVLWPDREDRFPGDDGVDPAAQPQLWLAPAEHPTGCWTQQ
jgi:hypothetical protein